MDRRNFARLGMLAGAGAMLPAAVADAAVPADGILEAGVREQAAQMQAGTLSAASLARRYLARIAAIDKAGPRINAVIEVNPDALRIAAAPAGGAMTAANST